MQNYGKWLGASAIVVTSLVGVTGCADRNKNGQPESVATTDEIANSTEGAASGVAGAVDNSVDAAANKMSGAGAAISNSVSGASTAVGGALNTGKIKSAILANPSLNSTKNEIDVTSKGNQVMLNGMVQNEAQKKLAGSIAQKNAGGSYKVMNNLKVTGGAANKM